MKKRNILMICLGFCLGLNAQNEHNLVPNSSFEDLGKKGKVKDAGEVYLAEPWRSITMNPVDLYSDKTKDLGFSTPENERGEEKARTGSNYAGVNFFGYKGKVPRTYLGVEFTEPMKEDQEYCLKFHISMSDKSKYAVNNVGMLVTFGEITEMSDANLYDDPHLISVTNRVYSKQYSWEAICGRYLAEGDERYIIIGNFAKDEDTKQETVRLSREFSGRQTTDGYYYIDDVSVIPTDKIGEKDCACEKIAGGQMKVEYKSFGTKIEDKIKAQRVTIVNSDGTKMGEKKPEEKKEEASKTVEQGGIVYKKMNAEPEPVVEKPKVYSPADVVFQYDDKMFKEPVGGEEDIVKLVAFLKKNKKVIIQLEGHADPSESSIASIGKRRAALLKLKLTKSGIPSTQLKTIGHGVKKPASDVSENRRVTISVL
ncbi:MAG: OmpA family protein [Flavobacteriales bacterium]|nr:OmpA family protein [Flavobacteriales bacterium]